MRYRTVRDRRASSNDYKRKSGPRIALPLAARIPEPGKRTALESRRSDVAEKASAQSNPSSAIRRHTPGSDR